MHQVSVNIWFLHGWPFLHRHCQRLCRLLQVSGPLYKQCITSISVVLLDLLVLLCLKLWSLILNHQLYQLLVTDKYCWSCFLLNFLEQVIDVSEDLWPCTFAGASQPVWLPSTHGRAIWLSWKGIHFGEKDVKVLHKNGYRLRNGFVAGNDRVGILGGDHLRKKR